MSDRDVDKTMAVLGAAGLAWGLAEIRRTAPRLFAAIMLLFSLVLVGVLIWFTADLVRYQLTTPVCEQQGTCVAH